MKIIVPFILLYSSPGESLDPWRDLSASARNVHLAIFFLSLRGGRKREIVENDYRLSWISSNFIYIYIQKRKKNESLKLSKTNRGKTAKEEKKKKRTSNNPRVKFRSERRIRDT